MYSNIEACRRAEYMMRIRQSHSINHHAPIVCNSSFKPLIADARPLIKARWCAFCVCNASYPSCYKSSRIIISKYGRLLLWLPWLRPSSGWPSSAAELGSRIGALVSCGFWSCFTRSEFKILLGSNLILSRQAKP